MAQFKSPPWDLAEHTKLQVTLRLLRTAADRWAKPGAEAVPVDAMIAVLLRVFAASWSERLPNIAEMSRSLQQWLDEADCPLTECTRLALNPSGARRSAAQIEWAKAWLDVADVRVAVGELRELLTDAARSWTDGYPERPATDEVLHGFVMILFRHRLVRHPPPSRIDG
jgi:hypothetical protein